MSLDINSYMQFILILVLAFAGALSKDYYDTMTDEDENIRIGKILLGTVTGSLITMVVGEYTGFIQHGSNLSFLFYYFGGMGGFKMFEWLVGVDVVKLLFYMLRTDMEKVAKDVEKELEEFEEDKEDDDG